MRFFLITVLNYNYLYTAALDCVLRCTNEHYSAIKHVNINSNLFLCLRELWLRAIHRIHSQKRRNQQVDLHKTNSVSNMTMVRIYVYSNIRYALHSIKFCSPQTFYLGHIRRYGLQHQQYVTISR